VTIISVIAVSLGGCLIGSVSHPFRSESPSTHKRQIVCLIGGAVTLFVGSASIFRILC
jgi:hypothetical protein